MAVVTSSIAMLRHKYLNGEADPLIELNIALAHANSNLGHNVYLAQDPDWSRNQARNLRHEDAARKPLWGVPVALKDCFDLAGFTTSCGSAFYRDHHDTAETDSAVAARLRSAGAVITGKTHLHQLAYGITGENRDFGNCLQPLNPAHLTGGSSSGAAASVQEGSALAAIGTDTGGSIRVPAALCGLAGYRCSITLSTPELWRGGYHLADSFDTLGWLYRDLADGPMLGHALFDLPHATLSTLKHLRIASPNLAFLHDCEPDVLATLHLWKSHLQSHGITLSSFDAGFWADSTSIYAHIQANEAAAIHLGHFHHFEPIIADRLAWGESLTAAALIPFHNRLAAFRASTYALFQNCDYLLFPCAPVSSLVAGADHAQTRARILRYTTPMSLAGLPVVTLPSLSSGAPEGGLQLVGPLGSDAALLALSASLSEVINEPANRHRH